jgi:hypothetical protein
LLLFIYTKALLSHAEGLQVDDGFLQQLKENREAAGNLQATLIL